MHAITFSDSLLILVRLPNIYIPNPAILSSPILSTLFPTAFAAPTRLKIISEVIFSEVYFRAETGFFFYVDLIFDISRSLAGGTLLSVVESRLTDWNRSSSTCGGSTAPIRYADQHRHVGHGRATTIRNYCRWRYRCAPVALTSPIIVRAT